MTAQAHKELLDQYLSSAGDIAKVKDFEIFSKANFVKLKYFIKQLGEVPTVHVSPETVQDKEETVHTNESKKKGVFNDLISQYPPKLHDAYKKRYEYWLEACSLKVQLNAVEKADQEKAYKIQVKLFDAFEKLDKCQTALDHYNEHKRILSIESKEDFSKLSPIEILKTRNNLRSNITKRKATIKKMEAELPNPNELNYKKELHLLNRKKEQLQEYVNQVESLNELINE